ncbi:MAG: outer membrane beta-barrel protein [Flavobacteriales bacterium]|nr:outer membrane beta-barrel protein [Flavobacteriales bacterium]
MNRINWNIRLTTQDNKLSSGTDGRTSFWPHDSTAILLNNKNNTALTALNLVSNVLYQHRFQKARRTFSLDFNVQVNSRNGHGDYLAMSTYYLNADSVVQIHQAYESVTRSLSLSPILSFTEPVGDSSMLVMNFKPSWQDNSNTRLTDDLVQGIDDYSELSNKFSYQYNKMAGSISYNYNTKMKEFSAGFDAEQSELSGLQTFPVSDTTQRTFFNILPRISFVKRFASKASFSVNLTSTTQSPMINQLQDVLDVSNPLFIKSGNANLCNHATIHWTSDLIGESWIVRCTLCFLRVDHSVRTTSVVPPLFSIEIQFYKVLTLPEVLKSVHTKTWTTITPQGFLESTDFPLRKLK